MKSVDGTAVPCAIADAPCDAASLLFLTSPLPEKCDLGHAVAIDDPSVPRETSMLSDYGQLRGIESHGYCVSRLPPSAVRLAFSASCPNEVFSIGRNVIALQCHPEFSLEVVNSKLWPPLVEQLRRLSAEEIVDSRSSFVRPTNNEALRSFLRRFLSA